jgi:hypothetical protein
MGDFCGRGNGRMEIRDVVAMAIPIRNLAHALFLVTGSIFIFKAIHLCQVAKATPLLSGLAECT